MALFKILSGNSDNFNTDVSSESVSPAFNEGYCYFIKDNQKLYVDWLDGEERKRTALTGENLIIVLSAEDAIDNGDGSYTFNLSNDPLMEQNITESFKNGKPIKVLFAGADIDQIYLYETVYPFAFGGIVLYGVDYLIPTAPVTGLITFDDDSATFTITPALLQQAMLDKGVEGKIAVYSASEEVSGKDLWYTLHLVNVNGDGTFECDNTTIDNFITNDNVNSIKVSLEFDDNPVKKLTTKERFEQRKAFQKANFTVSLDTDGITITDSNQELKYLKISLLVDNTFKRT